MYVKPQTTSFLPACVLIKVLFFCFFLQKDLDLGFLFGIIFIKQINKHVGIEKRTHYCTDSALIRGRIWGHRLFFLRYSGRTGASRRREKVRIRAWLYDGPFNIIINAGLFIGSIGVGALLDLLAWKYFFEVFTIAN